MLKIIHARTELGTPTRIGYADTITETEVTLSAEYGPVVVKRKRRGWRADNEERLVAEIYEDKAGNYFPASPKSAIDTSHCRSTLLACISISRAANDYG